MVAVVTGLGIAGLLLVIVAAFLIGLLTGGVIDWDAVRRDPRGFRAVIVTFVLLAVAAALIVASRGR